VSLPAIRKFNMVSRSSLSVAEAPSEGSDKAEDGGKPATFVDVEREEVAVAGLVFVVIGGPSLLALLLQGGDGVATIPDDAVSELVDPVEPEEEGWAGRREECEVASEGVLLPEEEPAGRREVSLQQPEWVHERLVDEALTVVEVVSKPNTMENR
jgi:hypothetical protein